MVPLAPAIVMVPAIVAWESLAWAALQDLVHSSKPRWSLRSAGLHCSLLVPGHLVTLRGFPCSAERFRVALVNSDSIVQKVDERGPLLLS